MLDLQLGLTCLILLLHASHSCADTVPQPQPGTDTHLGARLRLAQPKPLRGFDEEVRDFVGEQYALHGLNLHPTASPTRIERGPDGKLTLTAESKSEGKVRAPERRAVRGVIITGDGPCLWAALAQHLPPAGAKVPARQLQ